MTLEVSVLLFTSMDDATHTRILALAFAATPEPGTCDEKTRRVAAATARLRATAQAYIAASQATPWEILGVAVALLVSAVCVVLVAQSLDPRYLWSCCVTLFLCATGIVLGTLTLFGWLVVTLAPQPQFERPLAPSVRVARLLDDPELQAKHDKYQRCLRNPLLSQPTLGLTFMRWESPIPAVSYEYDIIAPELRDVMPTSELEYLLCLRVLGRALSVDVVTKA